MVLISAASATLLAAAVPVGGGGSWRPIDPHQAAVAVRLDSGVRTPQLVWVEVLQIVGGVERPVLMAPMVVPDRPLGANAAPGDPAKPSDGRTAERTVLLACERFSWRHGSGTLVDYSRRMDRVSDPGSYWARIRTGESVVAEPQVQQLFPDGNAQPGRYLEFVVRAKAEGA